MLVVHVCVWMGGMVLAMDHVFSKHIIIYYSVG